MFKVKDLITKNDWHRRLGLFHSVYAAINRNLMVFISGLVKKVSSGFIGSAV